VDSVADLRRVIRRIERARPPRPAPEPVEAVLGGEVVKTEAGELVAVRHRLPFAHQWGSVSVARLCQLDRAMLGLLAPALEGAVDPQRVLFLDTETTGLAGGTGTYAFLVGVAQIEGDGLVLTQYLMRDLDEEPALLAALAPLLEGASALVTFNGAGFDVPLLETRFILQRRRWPAVIAHIDLMRPARRVWRGALNDCRLGTLERLVLGVEREHDVPGFLIPQIYFDFLRRRAAAPLRRVLAHNRADVLALVALLGWFASAVGGERDDLTPAERAGLGRLWEAADAERACACYAQALAAGLDGEPAQAVRLRLARWEKRRARWDAARALWQCAVEGPGFDPHPWEELAKFHEHRARDMGAARLVVTTALDRAEDARASARVRGALAYRLARLERRLARGRVTGQKTSQRGGRELRA
jgi:uncharacterized protein YprB with RNaseH-like and TPR domain